MKVLYIAGPMSGLPEFNYPAFRAAEQQLRAANYDVLNPILGEYRDDAPREDATALGGKWDDYMRNGINQLIRADGVALLPGWDKSKGAGIEWKLAEDLGLRCRPLARWLQDAEVVAA
jgi:hypothetical protein